MSSLYLLFFTFLLSFQESKTQSPFIIGGSDASDGQIPYQASLRLDSGNHICSGSIIGPRWIVTAAHCLYTMHIPFVMVGSIRKSSGGTRYNVTKQIKHLLYNHKYITNDIGLLKTSEDIIFNLNVRPIPLADFEIQENVSAIVSGWGALSDGTRPDILKVLNTLTFNMNKCASNYYPIPISSKQLCSFTRVGEGVCSGDSGGPLASNGKLHGIISMVKGCGVGNPDVHARVYSYRWWITWKQILNQ